MAQKAFNILRSGNFHQFCQIRNFESFINDEVEGKTLLIEACERGDTDYVQFLLGIKGIDENKGVSLWISKFTGF